MTSKLAVPLVAAIGFLLGPCLATPAYADTIDFYCASTIPVDDSLDLYLQIDSVAGNAKTWSANVRGGPVLSGAARITDDEVFWTPVVAAVSDRVGYVFDRHKNVLKSLKYDGSGNLYNCKPAPGVKAP